MNHTYATQRLHTFRLCTYLIVLQIKMYFFYLVRDINLPNLFSPFHEYFFNKIWCYDYFNDAVKCILKPPQDLEKVGLGQ